MINLLMNKENDLYLVMLDFNGTLTKGSDPLNKNTISFLLEMVKDPRIIIAIVSSYPYGEIRGRLCQANKDLDPRKYGNFYICDENGGRILNQERGVSNILEEYPHLLEEAFELCNKIDSKLEEKYGSRPYQWEFKQFTVGLVITYRPLLGKEELKDEVKGIVDECTDDRWEVVLYGSGTIDIFRKEPAGKPWALDKLLQFHPEVRKVIVIGDGYNDLLLLEHAAKKGFTIGCPANAINEVKVLVGKYGGILATEKYGDGVVEILTKLLY